ncbi:hypothetical protein GCM10027261_04910 [Geodermatophilus arenarius]
MIAAERMFQFGSSVTDHQRWNVGQAEPAGSLEVVQVKAARQQDSMPLPGPRRFPTQLWLSGPGMRLTTLKSHSGTDASGRKQWFRAPPSQ